MPVEVAVPRCPSLPGTRDDRLSPSTTTSRPGHSQPVDPRADDLLRLCQRFRLGAEPSVCAVSDLSAALQGQCRVWGGVLVPVKSTSK